MNIKIRSMLAIALLMASFQVNAQTPECVGFCEGPLTMTSYTTPAGKFSVAYKDCGGNIEIVSITCNGASVAGSLLFTNALFYFFQNRPSVNWIKIPATCMKWQQSVGGGGEQGGTGPQLSMVRCSETGCCFFDRGSNGMLHIPGIVAGAGAPMCGNDCFEICQGQ